jgi:hypothetical protein
MSSPYFLPEGFPDDESPMTETPRDVFRKTNDPRPASPSIPVVHDDEPDDFPLTADDDMMSSFATAEDLRTLEIPEVLRVQSLDRTTDDRGLIRNTASLFHDQCLIRVEWITQHVDTRIHQHGLVSVRHPSKIRGKNGALRIERLLPADRPLPSVNLFETIPLDWVGDRALVQRAIALWKVLPRPTCAPAQCRAVGERTVPSFRHGSLVPPGAPQRLERQFPPQRRGGRTCGDTG